MNNLEKYKKLKESAEQLQRSIQKSQGVLDLTIERLQRDYDCATLQQAKDLLESSKKKESELGEKIDSMLADFVKEWESLL